MGTVSNPVSNTVRSATVNGVIRFRRIKPFTPPQDESDSAEEVTIKAEEARIADRKLTLKVFAAAFFGGALGGGIFALIGGLI